MNSRQKNSSSGQFVRSHNPGECRAPAGDCAKEIGPDNWSSFLDDFNKQRRDRPVTVELRGTTDDGAHVIAQHTPLVGITVDRHSQDSPLEVILGGDARGTHLTHVIRQPTRLWVQRDAEGHELVQVLAADGTSTVLRFEE